MAGIGVTDTAGGFTGAGTTGTVITDIGVTVEQALFASVWNIKNKFSGRLPLALVGIDS
jgi:hypothetical protein